MHMKIFAVVISILAIVCAFFGTGDKFAIKNVEEIHSKASGYPTTVSIVDFWGVAATAGSAGCRRTNKEDPVSCDGTDGREAARTDIYQANTDKLVASAATLIPETQWTINQGIDGMGRRTNKNDVAYGDVQIPSTFSIPDMPTPEQLNLYLAHEDGKVVLADWKQVCLRDEDDSKSMGDYKRIMRGGKWIFDPHALDRRVFTLPVQIFGDYKTQVAAIKKSVEKVCTFSFVFPTSRENNMHMLACAQTNSDSSRRAMAKAFGLDAKGTEKHEIDFKAFAKAAYKHIDGYAGDKGLPAADSYLGQWIMEYATNQAAEPELGPRGGAGLFAAADYTAVPQVSFYPVDCTADGDTDKFLSHQCGTLNEYNGAGVTEAVVSRFGQWWLDYYFEVEATVGQAGGGGAAEGTLQRKAAGTPDIRYPVEFSLTGTVTIAELTAKSLDDLENLIECRHTDEPYFNIKGGTQGCVLNGVTPNNVVIRMKNPLVSLADVGKCQDNAVDQADFSSVTLSAPSVVAAQRGKMGGAGTAKNTLSEANYFTLIDYMEDFVDAWIERGESFAFPTRTYKSRNNVQWWIGSELFQPLGPDSMTVAHLCQSTMNTYHKHPIPTTPALTHANGKFPAQAFMGLGSQHCLHTTTNNYNGPTAIGDWCVGQHVVDAVGARKTVVAGIANQFQFVNGDIGSTGAWSMARFATVDYPEYEIFRTIQFQWWYRGEEILEEKLNDLSGIAHYTDSITADEEHCDSFVSPGHERTVNTDRFAYTNGRFVTHGLIAGMDTVSGQTGVSVGGISPEPFADTTFTSVEESTTGDIKCQNTCKRIKATNGVMLVSGGIYTILLIGLLLPYDTTSGITEQLKLFLFVFLVVSTVFTVSTAVHSGSLQRIDSAKLECTFYNDTDFFDQEKYDVNDGTDTVLGQGMILLWTATALSACVWFIILALFVGAMKGNSSGSYVSVNDFFFYNK